MSELRYPDNGQLLEDASILRNAIQFSTQQRAFVAYNILRQPLEHMNEEALAFHAVEAFMAELVATEDTLGWVLVLREWEPGDLTKSLWPLLDKVQVGSGKYSEEAAAELLNGLDPSTLRDLLHIPTDEELAVENFSQPLRAQIDTAMSAGLDSLKRLVVFRQEQDRLRVRGYNKLKHHLLALRSDNRVLVPVWEGLDRNPGLVTMATVEIGYAPPDVRLLASRAIIASATLNSWLGVIALTRFGEPYETPQWVVNSFNLRGWRKETP